MRNRLLIGHPALLSIAMLSATVLFADEQSDESQAIKKIELLGGKVTRDDELPGRPVIGVDFRESKKFGDKYCHLLHSFPQLTTLSLFQTKITDAGLKEIAGLKTLAVLNLERTKITDAGVTELSKLKNLKTLVLFGTKITNSGLKELSQVKTLTTLNLGWTNITNDGLKELSELKNLTTLDLSYIQITNTVMKELKESLPNCEIIQ